MEQTNVANMNGYYSRQYSTEDLQRAMDLNDHGSMGGYVGNTGFDGSGMMNNQTLDEMINQNNKEMQRRGNLHQTQSYEALRDSQDQMSSRRSSMLEFGSGRVGELDTFQFEPASVPASAAGINRPGNLAQRRVDSQKARRRESAETLALNTGFQSLGPSYSPMTSTSPYQQPLNPSEALSLDMSGNYMSNDMLMSMQYAPQHGLDLNNDGEMTPMNNMFSQGDFGSHLTTSPLQSMPPNTNGVLSHDQLAGRTSSMEDQSIMDQVSKMQMSQEAQNRPVDRAQPSSMLPSSHIARQINADAGGSPNLQNPANLDVSTGPNGPTFPAQDKMAAGAGQPVVPQYRNAYSSTGFDMLGVLMRVASRRDPQINIGAVDMSCAFAVCDITQHDLPIVYCSDVFERLTGYNRHEILGRNCRFLQAPDGKIQAGVKRKDVDDKSVWRIKNMITTKQEMQISLINYRKGGQPFMNLLTMIPIRWDTEEFRYYVGFQVDLVEQPASITNKNPGKFGTACYFYRRKSHKYRWYIHDELPARSSSSLRPA